MMSCELCTAMAQLHCESDEASLCFDCDAMVHSANFLVARHSRVLLCRRCKGPTPWTGVGPRMGPTVSLCDRCFAGRSTVNKATGEDEVGECDEGVGENDDDDDDDGDEEEEGEGEEQVVPWAAVDPPPPASSSSSVETSMGPRTKRLRLSLDLASSSSFSSQDQRPCSSSSRPDRTVVAGDEATSRGSCWPLKDREKEVVGCLGLDHMAIVFGSFESVRPPI